jgi:hypothetical protein
VKVVIGWIWPLCITSRSASKGYEGLSVSYPIKAQTPARFLTGYPP